MGKAIRADDTRLIEAGFPCHQVGAETQRERGASSSLPPLYYLHVWWARRPLTPSRAAVLASLLPADADPDWFLRQLGIEKVEALVGGVPWTLSPKDNALLARLATDAEGQQWLDVDKLVRGRLEKEEKRREANRHLIAGMIANEPALEFDPVLRRWREEDRPFPPYPEEGDRLPVRRVAADPAFGKARIEWENAHGIRTTDDKYGYDRAYSNSSVATRPTGLTVLDPTAGGGSIPFEALRLGHNVIANELNPVAAVILHATLDYPARFGPDLAADIRKWGNRMRDAMVEQLGALFPASALTGSELQSLELHLKNYPELLAQYTRESLDGFLYCRQVTCPHCGGKSPLLNSCWLSKEGQQWGVAVVPDPKTKDVRFETYRAKKGHGPNGEDPEFATVYRGDGTCIHCRQAIPGDEIKRQARGESKHGRWTDRLFCVVAVRHQPKLSKGKIQRYTSGDREGQIKTEKVTFFRPPNETDLGALDAAEKRLREKWDQWEAEDLIPTEEIPPGHRRDERDIIVKYGITHWTDMFTPRQLLAHVTLIQTLRKLTSQIEEELGKDRCRAVVTYLQFAIDKGLDYNSKHTVWHAGRGVLSHAFTRHDFSLKWAFGEMIMTGPSSGVAWALAQVEDSYRGIAKLLRPVHDAKKQPRVEITNTTAAHLADVSDETVDLICMDPPYYNNVQYAELSDYFYVWNRRTLADLYPSLFRRRLTTKTDEAVANPFRHGGKEGAKQAYEKTMRDIFSECRRVIKPDGVMTLMFTHKEQEAWETLTLAIIDSGWVITASAPVESEGTWSAHVRDTASAASSIFITCRKRLSDRSQPATWTGFGGTGVQQRVAQAVAEALPDFERLKLNAVDEMVASYGRALRVLSEHWPVLDGDEPVSPIRAMTEASRVVSERQITRITEGRLRVDDLNPEATMALTLYGVFGLAELPYDEALSLSRSLNIRLDGRPGGYKVAGRLVGINNEGTDRAASSRVAESAGFHAPLLRKGSKLRLALPEERSSQRLESPQTEWDILHGVIMAYRRGDVPVARAYLNQHAADRQQLILDLLHVWTQEMDDERLRKEGQTILFGLR
jgi:putative DNA methylase